MTRGNATGVVPVVVEVNITNKEGVVVVKRVFRSNA